MHQTLGERLEEVASQLLTPTYASTRYVALGGDAGHKTHASKLDFDMRVLRSCLDSHANGWCPFVRMNIIQLVLVQQNEATAVGF